MPHETVLALLATCLSGYAMVYSGLGKRMLRLGTRGRCRTCGRVRAVCTCGGRH